MTDRESCIVLNAISGVGFVKFNALIKFFGSPAKVLEASRSELAMVHGVGEKLSAEIADWRNTADFENETARVEKSGARIVTWFDEDYPEVLRQLPDPPLCLYVSGTLPDFDARDFVAVVGSRRASHYGRRMARALSEQAVLAGWGTVSGLAFGVDYEAHDATVKAGGVTVAVLGGGLGRIHPQDHIPLARAIVESGGAVISEYPMLFPVNRCSFPRRNRIIAGLSRGVIVTEAGRESGAIITANIALDCGKTVFAVPGNVDNPMAEGCNWLLKNGTARLTESFQDVLDEFNPGGPDDLFSLSEPKAEYESGAAQLTAPQRKLVDYLRDHGESSFDQIAMAVDFPPGMLSGLLAELEMSFTILQLPGRRYILR